MRRLLEWDEITPELVREWAYDTDVLLLDQDEELLLYDVCLVPTLLSLIQDVDCPKRTSIYYSLVQFTRELVTRRRGPGQTQLYSLIRRTEPPIQGLAADWYSYAQRLLTYLDPLGPVDRKTARRIARDLLIGVAGSDRRIFESVDTTTNSIRFELRTRANETVDICLDTGVFIYIPWYRDGDLSWRPEEKRFWWFWKW